MKKLATLLEIFFGIELDRERQACRSHDGVGLGGEQIIIEVAELRTEVARLRAERQDRGGEDVAKMSRRLIH